MLSSFSLIHFQVVINKECLYQSKALSRFRGMSDKNLLTVFRLQVDWQSCNRLLASTFGPRFNANVISLPMGN